MTKRIGGLYEKLPVTYYEEDALLDVQGTLAELLYVRGLVASVQHGLDGKITDKRLSKIAVGMRKPRLLADQLCRSGAWQRTEDGFQIVGYLDWHKSRAELEELSADKKRAADERWRREKGLPFVPPGHDAPSMQTALQGAVHSDMPYTETATDSSSTSVSNPSAMPAALPNTAPRTLDELGLRAYDAVDGSASFSDISNILSEARTWLTDNAISNVIDSVAARDGVGAGYLRQALRACAESS